MGDTTIPFTLRCTCTHGGGGHVPPCPFWVPSIEQYEAMRAKRDAATKRAEEAEATMHQRGEGLAEALYANAAITAERDEALRKLETSRDCEDVTSQERDAAQRELAEQREEWGRTLDASVKLIAEHRGIAAKYREALEAIREMMSPPNRRQFVMRGSLAFAPVYRIVDAALAAAGAGEAKP